MPYRHNMQQCSGVLRFYGHLRNYSYAIFFKGVCNNNLPGECSFLLFDSKCSLLYCRKIR